MRRKTVRCLGFLCAALLAACEPGNGPPPTETETADSGARAGSSQRLLTLAPNLTEIVFALGLGDRVVGVDTYSNYPPAAAAKTRVGGLFDPNFEAMVALEPDLAILLPSEADIGARLRRVGVDVLTVESETIDDVAKAMITIAERCGVADAGRRLAEQYRERLAPVGETINAGRDPPRVMISIGRESGRLGELLVAGPDTFLDELLTRLGAVNVFSDTPVRYPQVGLEEVLARAPTMILELNAAELPAEQRQALIEDWQKFSQIPAVAQQRIEVLAADYTLVPGPRLPLLYDRIGDMLSPGGTR